MFSGVKAAKMLFIVIVIKKKEVRFSSSRYETSKKTPQLS